MRSRIDLPKLLSPAAQMLRRGAFHTVSVRMKNGACDSSKVTRGMTAAAAYLFHCSSTPETIWGHKTFTVPYNVQSSKLL
eukprot:scaffold375507_cov20-Prasinocladus_malaysianus.AAC.1